MNAKTVGATVFVATVLAIGFVVVLTPRPVTLRELIDEEQDERVQAMKRAMNACQIHRDVGSRYLDCISRQLDPPRRRPLFPG